MKLNNAIIYLLGFAGTGKLTIGRELARMTGARLVDNHLINNPVFSLLPMDGVTPLPEKVWEHCWAIRHTVLEVIERLSPPDFSFIFTNGLYEGLPDDVMLFNEIDELARKRESLLFPVRLLCSGEELARRVISEARRVNHKDRDPENARRNVREFQVLTPPHPNVWTLDVTALSAQAAAQQILIRLQAIMAK